MPTFKLVAYIYEQLRIQMFHKNIHGLLLCVDVSDQYINFNGKTPEMMIFDSDVFSTRFYLHINCKCNHPKIVFVYRECIL